jgi:O-antigen/teichoic acid export membrane protein
VLNYALVPLHTAIFAPEEFGTISGLYAVAAFLNILLTFGMETTYFRFATKTGKESIYQTASTAVLLLATIFCGIILLFPTSFASFIGYPEVPQLVSWLAVIVWIDALVAIPFARLRLEGKVGQFVLARVSNIVLIVVLNLFFLWLLPKIYQESGWSPFLKSLAERLFDPKLREGYVFLANLIASASLILFLIKPISKIRIRMDGEYLQPMMYFTIPIVLTGFAGTLNDQLDKILIPLFMSKADLGVYSAVFKLSIFMVLATQAFRYAGEPFFFSNSEDKEAPELFAKVLYYFIVVSAVIYLGVCLNIRLLAYIFIRDEAMRSALYLLPLLLLGKLFYGVYINISIWYKIKDKTFFGTAFALVGATVTVLVNLLLIPVIGYLASAIACFLCYLIMTSLAYYYGRQYFPVPYKIVPAFIYIFGSALFVYLINSFALENFWIDSAVRFVVFIVILSIIALVEKRRWNLLSFN